MQKSDVIIIGAGAAGLMAARVLSKAGKTVTILEGRNRIGGRIMPLPEDVFGYPAQGGAEFVHGEAPVTHALLQEASLTYEVLQGEVWMRQNGVFTTRTNGPTNDRAFLAHKAILHEKLHALQKDISIAHFLREEFNDEKYKELLILIERLVIDYDAGDPEKISTFALREEWLGGEDWKQGRIKEGYGALLTFLETQCKKNNVDIQLESIVKKVDRSEAGVSVTLVNGESFQADTVLVTLPPSILNMITFLPAIPEKMAALGEIGFGKIVKALFTFKSTWWLSIPETDFSKMAFMLSDGKIPTWWTQFPNITIPVLTGWLPSKPGENLEAIPDESIIEAGIITLVDTFGVSETLVRQELVHTRVINWPREEFTRGAYSYPTPTSDAATEELRKPIDNKIFFAGEALYSGKDTATVEGALASGLETAEKMLEM